MKRSIIQIVREYLTIETAQNILDNKLSKKELALEICKNENLSKSHYKTVRRCIDKAWPLEERTVSSFQVQSAQQEFPEFGIVSSPHIVRNPKDYKGSPDYYNVNETEDSLDETFNKDFIPRTLEEACAYSQIDTGAWEPSRMITNHWGNGLHQIKITFSRRDFNSEQLFDSLFSRYEKYVPPVFKREYEKTEKQIAILNLYDAHLDKTSIKSRCGEESSLENNIAIYNEAVDKLLNKIDSEKVERIIFPIGNDLFHVNNTGRLGTTKKGTILEYYCDPVESYERICEVVIDNIHKVLSVAPVYIPFIKGNHDEDNVAYLSFLIYKLFEKDKNVEIDKSKLQRKYYCYGDNLFGFAHGDKEKSKINLLPLIMAQESKDWSSTRYRKIFCGDLHHTNEYKFLKSKDMPGVEVEFLRSIGTSDEWHVDNGYLGIPKTASAEIWAKKGGRTGKFEISFGNQDGSGI